MRNTTLAKQGLIVIGAKGTLGSAFLSMPICKKTKNLYRYDRVADLDAGISECDLSSSDSVASALENIPFETCDRWRLVFTSGVYNGAAAISQDWDEIQRSLNVNLINVAQLTLAFAKKLKALEKSGRIVIVSSAASSVGSNDFGYGIAKAGLTGIVRSASKIFAKNHITIIGVAPGIFESAMSAGQSAARKQAAIDQTHLGRSLELQEIVDCVAFAAFDAPEAMTGTFLSPNGGQIIGPVAEPPC